MQDGSTALIMAAERGHKDVLELLLDRGADLGAKAGVRQMRELFCWWTVCRRHGPATDRVDDGGGMMRCWVLLAVKLQVALVACLEDHGC